MTLWKPHILVVILFSINAKYGVTGDFTCAETCSGERDISDLGILREHKYEFGTSYRITSPTDETASTSYSIRGDATIVGSSECNYLLKLENVKVHDIDNDESKLQHLEFANSLQKTTLVFGFDNGIVTNICPSSQESQFSQNVKVAIVSHLQVKLDSLNLPTLTTEDDVSGTCLTEYSPIESSKNTLYLRKFKSTSGCTNKYKYRSQFNGVDFGIPKETTNFPMLEGDQVCEINLDIRSIVTRVECTENLTVSGPHIKSWSELNKIHVSTYLRHRASTSIGSLPEKMDEPIKRLRLSTASRFFPEHFSTKEGEGVSELLVKVVNSPIAQKAELFLQLVQKFKQLSSDQLKALSSKHNDKIFEDMIITASMLAKTDQSFEYLSKIPEKIPSDLIWKWSSIPNPSLEQITAIKEILQKIDYKQYILVTSTLLNKYCKSDEKCMENEKAKEIASHLESILLNDGCQSHNSETFEKVITTLRGISNFGRVSSKKLVYPALERCMQDRSMDIFVRASAAEAFHQFSCDNEADIILANTMNDEANDIEVRIQAYRSWARCLDDEKLMVIFDLISLEKNNQYLAFVASHLQSLANSRDVAKGNLRRIIRNFVYELESLKSYSQNNFLTHSNYIEKTFETGQLSGGIEAVVVHGPQNILPRYVSLNMTVNAFGNSFNLFEFGYRSFYSKELSQLFFNKETSPQYASLNKPFAGNNFLAGSAPPNDEHTQVFMREFGHEVFHTFSLEEYVSMIQKEPLHSDSIFLDDSILVPTSGGLTLQISLSGASSHKASSDMSVAKLLFEFDNKISVAMVTEIAIQSPSGMLGFQTNDNVYAGFDFSLRLQNELSGDHFKMHLRGSKPNEPVVKYSRSVNIVKSGYKNPLKPAGKPQQLVMKTPKIVNNLFGVTASVKRECYSMENADPLCTDYSLIMENNDGLSISFDYWKTFLYDNLNDTIKVSISRPGTKMEVPETGNLFDFTYNKLLYPDDTWKLQMNLLMPWQNKYSLRVKSIDGSNYAGEVELNTWRGSITGQCQLGRSQGERLSLNVEADKRNVRLFYDRIANDVQIEVESTLESFPFNLRSVFNATEQENLFQHNVTLDSPYSGQTGIFWNYSSSRSEEEIATTQIYWQNNGHRKEFTSTLRTASYDDYAKEGFNYSISNIIREAGEKDWRLDVGTIGVMQRTNGDSVSVYVRNWFDYPELPAFNFNTSLDFNLQYNRAESNGINTNLLLTANIPRLDLDVNVGFELNSNEPASQFRGSIPSRTQFSVWGRIWNSIPEMYMKATLYKFKGTYLYELDYTHYNTDRYSVKSIFDMKKMTHLLLITAPRNREFRIESSYVLNLKYSITAEILTNISVDSRRIYFMKNAISYTATEQKFELQQKIERIKKLYGIENPETLSTFEILFSFMTDNTIYKTLNTSIHATFPKLEGGISFDLQTLLDTKEESTVLRAHSWIDTLDNKNKQGAEISFSSNGKSISNFKSDMNVFVYGRALPGTYDKLKLSLERSNDNFILITLNGNTAAQSELTLRVKLDSTMLIKNELSIMFSIIPRNSDRIFNGVFYKSTSTVVFSAKEIKFLHNGEFNGNRGTAPGMPFRYGIEFTPENDYLKGQLYIFAEDTNMGKLTDFELLETMYEYDIQMFSLGRDLIAINNGIMVNWRKFLGRGVMGTQATLNVNVTSDLNMGQLKFATNLVDNNQTDLIILSNYVLNKDSIVVSSESFLKSEIVHKFIVNAKTQKTGLHLTISGDIPMLSLKVDSKTAFTHSIDQQLQQFDVDCQTHMEITPLFCSTKLKLSSFTGSQGSAKYNSKLSWDSNMQFIENGIFNTNFEIEPEKCNFNSLVQYKHVNFTDIQFEANSDDGKQRLNLNSDCSIFPIDLMLIHREPKNHIHQPQTHVMEGFINLKGYNLKFQLKELSISISRGIIFLQNFLNIETEMNNWRTINLSSSLNISTLEGIPKLDIMTVLLRETAEYIKCVFILEPQITSPGLEIFLSLPTKIFGITMFDFSSKAEIVSMGTQLNDIQLKAHVRTNPNYFNNNFRLKFNDNLLRTFISTSKLINDGNIQHGFIFSFNGTESDGNTHTTDIEWRIYRERVDSPYQFNVLVNVVSSNIPQGKISFAISKQFEQIRSLIGAVGIGSENNYNFVIDCSPGSDRPGCTLKFEDTALHPKIFKLASIKIQALAKEDIMFTLSVDEIFIGNFSLNLKKNTEHDSSLIFVACIDMNERNILNLNSESRIVLTQNGFRFVLNTTNFYAYKLAEDNRLEVYILAKRDANDYSLNVASALNISSDKKNYGWSKKWQRLALSDSKFMINMDVSPIISVRFLGDMKMSIVDLMLSMSPSIEAKFRTNLLHLMRVILQKQWNTNDLIPPGRNYYIWIGENGLSLELEMENRIGANLICNIVDMQPKLIFQSGYFYSSASNSIGHCMKFEMDEPNDAKLLIEYKKVADRESQKLSKEIIIGIVYEDVIPKSLTNLTIVEEGRTTKIDINTRLPDSIKLVAELEYDYNIVGNDYLFFIAYKSAKRNADLRIQTTESSILYEIAWNRLNNGSICLMLNSSKISITTPTRNFRIGSENLHYSKSLTYYIHESSRGGDENTRIPYLEVTFDSGNKFELRSHFLKVPLLFTIAETYNTFRCDVYNGTIQNIDSLYGSIQYNITERSRLHIIARLVFQEGNKVLNADIAAYFSGRSGYVIGTNFTYDGKNGSFMYKYIPSEKLLIDFNNQLYLELSQAVQSGVFESNYLFYYRQEELISNGKLRLTNDPISAYALFETPQREGVVSLKAEDIFNLEAEAHHCASESDCVLDAQLVTHLDEASVYHLDSFLRNGAISEFAIDGIGNLISKALVPFITNTLEAAIGTFEDQLLVLEDLLNQTAINESYWRSVNDLQLIIESMQYVEIETGTVNGKLDMTIYDWAMSKLQPTFKQTLCVIADSIYKEALRSLNAFASIVGYVGNLNSNSYPWIVTMEQAKTVGYWTHSKINSAIEVSLRSLESFYDTLRQSSRKLTMGGSRMRPYSDSIIESFNRLHAVLKEASAFDDARAYFKDLRDNVLEAVQCAQNYISSTEIYRRLTDETKELIPLLKEGKFLSAFKYYTKPEKQSFSANWAAVTINGTFYIPPSALQLTSLKMAMVDGILLNNTSAEERASALTATTYEAFCSLSSLVEQISNLHTSERGELNHLSSLGEQISNSHTSKRGTNQNENWAAYNYDIMGRLPMV